MTRSLSNLDYPQVLRYVYDESSGTLKTGANVALELSIQAGATTGAISASEMSSVGASILNIHALAGSVNLNTAACAHIQYSPSDDDNVWINTGLALQSSTGASTVVTGTAITSLLARRVRVVLDTAPSGGDVTYYLIGR